MPEINLGNVNDQQEEIELNNFRVVKLDDTIDEIYEELAQKVDKSSVGVASGVASLDSAGKVPSAQLPSYIDDTAGDGDTDKVWSADKLHDTIPNISIQGKRLVIT